MVVKGFSITSVWYPKQGAYVVEHESSLECCDQSRRERGGGYDSQFAYSSPQVWIIPLQRSEVGELEACFGWRANRVHLV